MFLVLTSLLSRASFWIQFFFSGLLRAWQIFWQSDASTAFMAGACLVLFIVLIIGLAERRMELTMAELLAQSAYVPQGSVRQGQPTLPEGRPTEQEPSVEAKPAKRAKGLWTKIRRGFAFLSLAFKTRTPPTSNPTEAETPQVAIPSDTQTDASNQPAPQKSQETQSPGGETRASKAAPGTGRDAQPDSEKSPERE